MITIIIYFAIDTTKSANHPMDWTGSVVVCGSVYTVPKFPSSSSIAMLVQTTLVLIYTLTDSDGLTPGSQCNGGRACLMMDLICAENYNPHECISVL